METWIDRQAQMDFAVNKAMKQGLLYDDRRLTLVPIDKATLN